jgi:hypothetical protein
MEILNFIKSNTELITIVITLLAGSWPLIRFLEYLKDKRFKTYHELIDNLVNEQRQPGQILKLDRQIAIIFELRNFSSYYPVTERILKDLKILWKDQERIKNEIDFTLYFISRNRFKRFFLRHSGK